ncbi:MAG: hypothetical protein JXA42_07855 [Anaerolineales bacterium]|nr:hypothetical protein [Anaerolineales bacterium]
MIYLHGALVWTALMSFAAAGVLGIIGLAIHKARVDSWTRAAGRVALLFWAGYLPISMWAARATWGNSFLQDPSFARAFRILAVSIIVQTIIWLIPMRNWIANMLNIAPLIVIIQQLGQTQQLLHPDGPIRNADSVTLQVYFYGLTLLCAGLAIMTGWLFTRLEPVGNPSSLEPQLD